MDVSIFMFFGNQADKLKGEIMAKVKEVWVRFSNTETYYEKEGELLSILANASGDCVVKVYCNAALYSRRKKHFIFDSINTITAPSFR